MTFYIFVLYMSPAVFVIYLVKPCLENLVRLFKFVVTELYKA